VSPVYLHIVENGLFFEWDGKASMSVSQIDRYRTMLNCRRWLFSSVLYVVGMWSVAGLAALQT